MTGVSRMAPALVGVGLLLCAVSPVLARALSPYQHYSASLFANGNLRLSFQKQWSADSPPEDGPGTVSPMLLALSASSFRTVSGPIMPKRIASKVAGLDDGNRRDLEAALLDLLKGYEQLLDRNDDPGLKNNLAGAFNFLFASSYVALKDGKELSAAQQKNMLKQLNASIAMGLRDRRLSDLEKQEVYESTVLSGSIILGLYNEGRTQVRPERAKLARDMAREILDHMMGLSLEKVHVEGNSVRLD